MIKKGRLENQKDNIIQDYLSGKGITVLGKLYNTSPSTISYLLKRHSVQLNEGSKSKVKGNPFKDLNNPETQYWLGWLITDGNLHDKRINLIITEKDRDVLKNYCKFLNISNNNILARKSQNINWDICNTVRFGSKETYEFLINIGVTPNKSLTVNPSVNFTSDLIRGLIEGDGSIGIYNNKPKIVFSSSSIKIIEKYENFLSKNNINFSKYLDKNCKNPHWRISTICSNCLKLINLIYPNNCNLYCNRKYKKAMEIKETYPNYIKEQKLILQNN